MIGSFGSAVAENGEKIKDRKEANNCSYLCIHYATYRHNGSKRIEQKLESRVSRGLQPASGISRDQILYPSHMLCDDGCIVRLPSVI